MRSTARVLCHPSKIFLKRGRPAVIARIVDQDVHPTQLTRQPVDDAGSLFGAAQVEVRHGHAPAQLAHLGEDLRCPLPVDAVGDADVASVLGQQESGRLADLRACAGDDGPAG